MGIGLNHLRLPQCSHQNTLNIAPGRPQILWVHPQSSLDGAMVNTLGTFHVYMV